MVLNSLGTGVRVPSFLRGCCGEADPMLVKVSPSLESRAWGKEVDAGFQR